MTKRLQTKMTKLSTGGKVNYSKAIKTVKVKNPTTYGPKQTSKYASAAKKYLKKAFASLKIR